jgi:hypothetical protein
MQYFDTLPKIIQYDGKGTAKIFTNLLARASIIPELLKSPALYYQYDIQDGDTPEIVAHKYYGDSYRYWIVLFVNQILDPQWGWPLSQKDFNAYINKKYNGSTSIYSDVYHYEKVLTQYDYNTNTTTTNKVIVGEDTYNSIVPQTNTFSLPTGQISITVSKSVISIYDYELDLNEQKRSIKILNATYTNQIEEEFKKLMAN